MKIILSTLLLLSTTSFCDIRSTTGQIKFDTQMDHQTEMTLNSTGLGIAVLPSANLHVTGNAIISKQLLIGGNSGSSNLNVNGTIGYSVQTISANTTLDDSSLVLVDSSSDNIILTLPYAGNVSGRVYHIKKTTLLNSVWISGGGNLIDDTNPIELANNTTALPSVDIMSDGRQWYVINSKDLSATVASDNLVGWWKLDDNSGTIAHDSSDNSTHGTLNGSMTFSSNFTTGKLGNALSFDGLNDQIDFGNVYNNPIQPFTLSAWIKVPDITPVSKYGIIGGSQYHTGGFFLALSEIGDLEFVSNESGSENRLKTSVTSVGNNQWFFATITYNGTDKEIFVNGNYKNNTSATIDSTTNTFRIGHSHQGGWSYFSGEVDDVRFYNRVLTVEEIKAIYNQAQ